MSRFSQVLIVVPCLNEREALPRLLTWLVETVGEGDLIVVADGGSTDGSVAIINDFARRWPSVKLLHNPKRVQSAGVNLAASVFGTGFAWLLRLDAHCDYPKDYLELLLRAARATDATSVVVPMITKGTGCFQRAAAAAQNSVMGTGGSPHRHLVVGRYVEHGHHALMQMTAFNGVGGYDENFSHNEDAELDARLVRAGGRIWLEPQASLIYYPRRSAAALFRQYYSYGRGRARTILKHGIRPKIRQLAPLVVPPALLLAGCGLALAALDARFLVLTLPAITWFSICQLFAIVLAVRSKSLCVLASGTAAMVMHIAWSAGFWTQLARSRRVVTIKANV